MSIETAFLGLLCIASAVAILTRRLRLPYTVALVIAGVALGALSSIDPPHLTKELLFTLFLPGLLFEAAFHLEFAQFRKNVLAIGALAVPGLVASIALTALLVIGLVRAFGIDPAFAWSAALLFGALVAATDPIAVVAIFRAVNVPERLSVLVEGESLLNDGTSVVVLTLLLAYVSGAVPTAGGLATSFLMVTAGGLVVGGAIGLGAAIVTKRVDEPTIEISLTVIAAYGAFLLAEHWHLSGVIATVTAGMLCGSYARRVGMSPATRLAVESFWEYVAFALNSAVFLLLGFSVELSALARSWREILLGFLALLTARTVVVFGIAALLGRTRERISPAWAAVLTWGGLRGALSLVLALALPRDIVGRDVLVTMTAGVVLASILVQGLTIGPLLGWLGVASRTRSLAYDAARGDLRAAGAALREIARLLAEGAASPEVLGVVRTAYEARRAAAAATLRELAANHPEVRRDEAIATVRHLLTVERDSLVEDSRHGLLGSAAYAQLDESAAHRLVRLQTGAFEHPAELVHGLPRSTDDRDARDGSEPARGPKLIPPEA